MLEVMTTKDVADFLKTSRKQAVKMMKSEGFPLIRKDAQRYLTVLKIDLIRWIQKGDSVEQDKSTD